MAERVGAVQERAGHLRWLAGRGCASDGEGVGSRGHSGPDREMECTFGHAGPVERPGSGGGDLGSGGREYAGKGVGEGGGPSGWEMRRSKMGEEIMRPLVNKQPRKSTLDRYVQCRVRHRRSEQSKEVNTRSIVPTKPPTPN